MFSKHLFLDARDLDRFLEVVLAERARDVKHPYFLVASDQSRSLEVVQSALRGRLARSERTWKVKPGEVVIYLNEPGEIANTDEKVSVQFRIDHLSSVKGRRYCAALLFGSWQGQARRLLQFVTELQPCFVPEWEPAPHVLGSRGEGAHFG